MATTNLKFYDFIKPAFRDEAPNVIVRASRRTGKTYGAVQYALLQAFSRKNIKILWVDTVQSNIKRYIDEYFRKISGELWNSISYDKQFNTLSLLNGTKIFFGSAERPENLEGFGYDLVILNEAGIILKKDGLWYKTIQPMTKNAKTLFIGTPKGKTGQIYYELSQKAKTSELWKEYHYTVYDSPEWNAKQIEDIKNEVSTYIWKQEYLGEFADIYENSALPPDCLRYYDYINPDEFKELYIHADTTHTAKTTSDYFAIGVMGQSKRDNNYYLLDFILDKIDVERQANALITYYQKYGNKIKKITYDEKANQGFGYWSKKLAKDDYNLSLPLEPLNYGADKFTHFEPNIKHFKANRIFLPQNNPRINTLSDQLLAFPSKEVNDDGVDMISGLLDNFNFDNSVVTYDYNPLD